MVVCFDCWNGEIFVVRPSKEPNTAYQHSRSKTVQRAPTSTGSQPRIQAMIDNSSQLSSSTAGSEHSDNQLICYCLVFQDAFNVGKSVNTFRLSSMYYRFTIHCRWIID